METNDIPRLMAHLLRENGDAICTDGVLLRRFLVDALGEQAGEFALHVQALVSAVEAHIPEGRPVTSNPDLVDRLISRNISPDIASWAIETWVQVLNRGELPLTTLIADGPVPSPGNLFRPMGLITLASAAVLISAAIWAISTAVDNRQQGPAMQKAGEYEWSGHSLAELTHVEPTTLSRPTSSTQLADAVSNQEVLTAVSHTRDPSAVEGQDPLQHLLNWHETQGLSQVIPVSNFQYSSRLHRTQAPVVALGLPSIPSTFSNASLARAIDHIDYSILLYSSSEVLRFLVGVDKKSSEIRYAFDMSQWKIPTVGWAVESSGVLYISGWSPAKEDNYGNTGLYALDLKDSGKLLWRSNTYLLGETENFAIAGDMIFTTYSCGCDDELSAGPFAIDARTGEVLQDLNSVGGAEWLFAKGDQLHVRGYDSNSVFKINATKREPVRQSTAETIDLSTVVPQSLPLSQLNTQQADKTTRRKIFGPIDTTRNPSLPQIEPTAGHGLSENYLNEDWRTRHQLTNPSGTIQRVSFVDIDPGIPRAYGTFRLLNVWSQADRWFLFYGTSVDGVKEYRFVFAVDPAQGRVLYSFRLEGEEEVITFEESQGVLIARSYLYNDSPESGVFLSAFDLETGKPLWRLSEGDDVYDWYLHEGLVVRACCGPYGSDRNHLTAFDLRTGRHLQSLPLYHDPAEVVFEKGNVFIRGYQGESVIELNP